jgi:hypothetical protein
MPPPPSSTATTETGFSPVASKALPVCFTRPFAPNKNQEFLPILLFLNHQIGFSKFILEVGLCTHANLQARTQPVVITRWLAKQPSAVTHSKMPGIVVTSLHFL